MFCIVRITSFLGSAGFDSYAGYSITTAPCIISLIDLNQLPMLAFQDYQIFFLRASSTIEALSKIQLFHH